MAPFDFGAWRYARLERRLETYRLIIFFFRKSANAVLSNSLESSAGLTVDGRTACSSLQHFRRGFAVFLDRNNLNA